LKLQNSNQEGELMTILSIPLKNSPSVVEFFRQAGKVEIPRPKECFYEPCRLKEPLRKNGSYAREVIYWGLCFVVQIFRFRCGRCGKTASCPYGWLVPYCRFAAETITAGIEAYARARTEYRDISADLSDLELAEPELDIRSEEMYREMVAESAAKKTDHGGEGPAVSRPAHTTVFRWVDFMCKHDEALLTQLQKELVQEKKRGREVSKLPDESVVENPNSDKAASVGKRRRLDRLSFATCAADGLLGTGKQQWYRLRAYFLATAESRKDVLTETMVQMPITQTFELVIF
jgi:hypothetical protein